MAITYTITTNFGAKDSLPTGDSGKIIKGAEFTTEFNAIQSAFALAAPVASPTFTGTATIPTAAITTLNLGGVAVTATAAELNYVDGVTSNVQTQLDAKAPLASPTFTGAISIGSWDIELDGSDLVFQYNGTDVFKITTAGAVIAKDEVTAFGTP